MVRIFLLRGHTCIYGKDWRYHKYSENEAIGMGVDRIEFLGLEAAARKLARAGSVCRVATTGLDAWPRWPKTCLK